MRQCVKRNSSLFLPVSLAHADHRYGQGQRDGWQFFPIECGKAKTVQAERKDQRHKQGPLKAKSLLFEKMQTGASKLKNNREEKNQSPQPHFNPNRQIRIVRAA